MCASYCRLEREHGGVAIFLKSNFNYETLDLSDYTENRLIECCGIKFPKYNLLIIVLYRSPCTDCNNFLYKLNVLLCDILSHDYNVVIGGDFNIDILSQSENKKKFFDLAGCHGLKTVIDVPTRVSATSSSCLDNFLIFKYNMRYYTRVLNTCFSDHFGQLLVCQCDRMSEDKNIILYRRHFSNDNIQNFSNFLHTEAWDTVYSETCPSKGFSAFLEIFLHYFNLCFPLSRVNLKNKKKKNTAWISPEILEIKEMVLAASDLSRADPSYKDLYRTLNKYYQNLIVESKKFYYDNLISSASNKNKMMWQIIKEKTTNKEKNASVVLLKENNIVLSEKETANKFNSFFSSIGNNLANNFTSSIDYHYISNNISTPEYSFFITPATELDVLDCIRNLKVSPSSGFDCVSSKILKQVKNSVAAPLTFLINKSFETGIFPQKLKFAIIKPVFKKGNRSDVTNFRPISLLSTFSKVYESIMNLKLNSYLKKYKIIDQSQHGFTKERSLDTALFSFVNEMVSCVDQQSFAGALLIDLSKAFDCINHEALLHKMSRYGIRGVALKWFRSYLEGRSQQVALNFGNASVVSTISEVGVGVPQGSILGPILFIIFSNDLHKIIADLPVLLMSYADDTNILLQVNNYAEMEILANTVYSRISEWMSKNKLIINNDKTAAMALTLTGSNVEVEGITIDGRVTHFSQSVKLLGLYIDHRLDWSIHIDNLCKKLSSSCYGLRSLSKQCSEYVLRSLYFSSFHSHLRYGIMHWGISKDFNRVFILQKYAVRIMSGLARRQSCRNVFKEQSILTAAAVYIFETLCFVRRNIVIFQRNIIDHNYETRYRNKLNCEQHKTTFYQRGAFFNGCRLYNVMPISILNAPSLNCFKQRLKMHLINLSPYTVEEFLILNNNNLVR